MSAVSRASSNAWQSKELRIRRYEAILQRQRQTVQLLMEPAQPPTRSTPPQPAQSFLYAPHPPPEPPKLPSKRQRHERYLNGGESEGRTAPVSYRAYTQQEELRRERDEGEIESVLLQYERRKGVVDKQMEYLKSEEYGKYLKTITGGSSDPQQVLREMKQNRNHCVYVNGKDLRGKPGKRQRTELRTEDELRVEEIRGRHSMAGAGSSGQKREVEEIEHVSPIAQRASMLVSQSSQMDPLLQPERRLVGSMGKRDQRYRPQPLALDIISEDVTRSEPINTAKTVKQSPQRPGPKERVREQQLNEAKASHHPRHSKSVSMLPFSHTGNKKRPHLQRYCMQGKKVNPLGRKGQRQTSKEGKENRKYKCSYKLGADQTASNSSSHSAAPELALDSISPNNAPNPIYQCQFKLDPLPSTLSHRTPTKTATKRQPTTPIKYHYPPNQQGQKQSTHNRHQPFDCSTASQVTRTTQIARPTSNSRTPRKIEVVSQSSRRPHPA